MALDWTNATTTLAHVPGNPSRIRIGPEKHRYVYTNTEGVWTCSRGSDWSVPGEVLVLVAIDDYVVACDATIDPVNGAPLTRQQIFRIPIDDLPLNEGWHSWESNYAASRTCLLYTSPSPRD